jgi:hypothetical protein
VAMTAFDSKPFQRPLASAQKSRYSSGGAHRGPDSVLPLTWIAVAVWGASGVAFGGSAAFRSGERAGLLAAQAALVTCCAWTADFWRHAVAQLTSLPALRASSPVAGTRV